MLASRAAAHAKCNARTRFLSLPPHLRLLSHQQSQRSFSASPSTKFINPSDILTAPPLAVLEGLHYVGVPWYAAIPAAAVLIRGIFGYYFAAKPARQRQQIRNNLHPVIADFVALSIQRNPTGAGTFLAKVFPHPLVRRKVYASWLVAKTSHDVGKKFGAGMIAMSSFVNIFSLIATAESVRMLCGAREGLLSALLTPVTMVGRFFAPDHFPPSVNSVDVIADAFVNKVEQARRQSLGGNEVVDLEALSRNILPGTQLLPSQIVNTDTPHFDPSLQTEGLSWCADLTAIDPYAVLPTLTCAVMIGNILLNPRPTPGPTSLPSEKMWRPLAFMAQRYNFGQKLQVGLACAFGYVLQNSPAAVVLYIFSSVVTGFVQRKWVNIMMPLRSPIQPCTRMTRTRAKKQFSV